MRARSLHFVACAAALAACGVPEHGPSMDPGEDCVGCHDAGEGPDFTAAGTLYLGPHDASGMKGGVVSLQGADGRTVNVKSNEVGNFYTREKLAWPLRVVTVRNGSWAASMEDVPNGACNDCHTHEGRTSTSSSPTAIARGAPLGRVAVVNGSEEMLPGEDCQACHVAGGMARDKPFSASGTVYPTRAGGAGVAGATVTVTGRNGTFTATSNAVGNFWIEQDVGYPIAANATIVTGNGQTHTMDERIPSAQSCNRCHRPGGEGEGRVSLSGDD